MRLLGRIAGESLELPTVHAGACQLHILPPVARGCRWILASREQDVGGVKPQGLAYRVSDHRGASGAHRSQRGHDDRTRIEPFAVCDDGSTRGGS
jgi:hypothetical protein